MDELRNPYGPGAGTPPPALVGREHLLRSFEVAVHRTLQGRSARSLLPTGLRGVGKTVLLNEFTRLAEGAGLLAAFFEVPDSGSLARLIAIHLRRLLLEFDRRGAVSEAVKRALRVFRSFTVAAKLDGSLSFSVDVDPERGAADTGDLVSDLTDLFVAAGRAAAERGSGIVLAIDELQYLAGAELSAIIMAVHRVTQLQLPVLVVGAGLPQLPGLAGEAKSYSERLFEFPEIGRLSDADARAAVSRPAAEQDVRFTAGALDALVEVTLGYPYFLQEWAYASWNAADGSPVEHDVVERVRETVIAKLDRGFFRVRFDRLTPTEKRYMRAMAELGPGPHRSGEIAERYGAKVVSVAPIRSALIAKGMIYSPAHGDTAFTVPLFDDFMRRAMP